MSLLDFDWDESKNKVNQRKHGISFEEAKTVFYDENAREYHDPDHSTSEDRFIMLGMSFMAKVLVICHCYREKDSIIRIISARKANKSEQKSYGEVRS